MSNIIVVLFITAFILQIECYVPQIDWNNRNSNTQPSLVFVYDSSDRLTGNINDIWRPNRLTYKHMVPWAAAWLAPYHDYIFVPFFDEQNGGVIINPSIKTSLAEVAEEEYLLEQNEEVSEGCSKSIFTALKRALQLARNGSIIFVAIDGEPKDDELVESVKTLIREKRAIIHMYLTDRCTVAANVITTYRDVVSSSGGALVQVSHLETLRILTEYGKLWLKH